MSQWSRVKQLFKESKIQVPPLYGESFPIEIRDCIAEWLESVPWNELNENDPSHEQFALEWTNGVIKRIEETELAQNDFLKKLKLRQTAENFKVRYGENPFSLAHVVTQMLAAEKALIEECSEADIILVAEQGRPLLAQFEQLEKRAKDCDEELENLQENENSYLIHLEQSQAINNQLVMLGNETNGLDHVEQEIQLHTEKQVIDEKLQNTRQEIANQSMKLTNMFEESVHVLEKLLDEILESLNKWKRWQQLSGNEPYCNDKQKKVSALAMIQGEFETLNSLLWKTKATVEKMINNSKRDACASEEKLAILQEKLLSLLSNLWKSSLVIEDQPPQVLRRDSKFSAKVRFLLVNLNLFMRPPVIKASLISEDQARSLCMDATTGFDEKSGSIVNNEGCMEHDAPNNTMSVNLRNMTVTNVSRQTKKGKERIAEAKYRFLFQSYLHIDGKEVHVMTLSLPIIIIVHGNQECNAAATILWDNAFAKLGRKPFDVPCEVSWPDLAKCLSDKFSADCGKGLSLEQKNYLASKLFGQADDFSYQTVSWSQFCKDFLPGQKFTFWEWFYHCMKLTKERLSGPWSDGSLIGFISKDKAHSCLQGRPTGTFLLRFSESVLGGLTIVWVHQGKKAPEILDLQPFSDKDFEKRPFTDIIRDLKYMQILYPDIPKSSAFGKYWPKVDQQTKKEVHGYVKWYFKIATAFMDIFGQS